MNTAIAPEAPMTGDNEVGNIAHWASRPMTPRRGNAAKKKRKPNRRSSDRPNTHKNKQFPSKWKISS